MFGRQTRTQATKHSFADILDDVSANEENRSGGEPRRFAQRASQGLWSALFEAMTDVAGSSASGSAERRRSYAADAEDEPEIVFASIEESAVAAELDLASARTLADLKRVRRSFALRNHPDRLHPRLRATANARMQLANMLLDRRRRELETAR